MAFEKSKKDKERKGMREGSPMEERMDKAQMGKMGFAKGGLAKTQANLKSMGRGLAKVANQKSGGKMRCGGSVRGK